MRDTRVFLDDQSVWLAANVNGDPSEPQVVVRHAAVRMDREAQVRLSFTEIPQVPDRHAVIVSCPPWCWGAMMGVNEAGVAIAATDACAPRGPQVRAPLLMDLVRLGLERADTAPRAVRIVTDLLRAHGLADARGGLVIADRQQAWRISIAHRRWQASLAAQVNGADVESSEASRSGELPSTKLPALQLARWREAPRLLVDTFGARARRVEPYVHPMASGRVSFAIVAAWLREHRHAHEDPARSGRTSTCRHARNRWQTTQTTGSMLVRLSAQGPLPMFTGTSAPCLSILRPAGFDDGDYSVLTPVGAQLQAALWRRHEWLHRQALADAELRAQLRYTRDDLERQAFALLSAKGTQPAAMQRADRLAAAWHKVLWETAAAMPVPRLPRFWRAVARRDSIDPTRRLAGAQGQDSPQKEKKT